MNKLNSMLLCAATGLAFTSCATVFCGSRAKVTFDTNVPVESATLTIDGKKHQITTFPYKAKVKRGFTDTEVKAEAPGYETVRFTIYKNFNAVSVINLFDVLGWGIDAATGAMMKPDQRSYEIMFKKPTTEETKTE
ncbi:hypothetical protein [Rikenella microfusus]|uniref:hypothetical protein n=1 Tax=Rikenella microfusus TaxID=28139 RepID=UPI003A91806E